MTPAQAATVLALAAAFDNRTVGEANAIAWSEALDERVALDDAKQIVVDHYARTREWIMPSDINTASAALRRDRLSRMRTPEPPADLSVTDELVWQRVYRAAIGDGFEHDEADARACAELGIVRPEQITSTRPVLALVEQTAKAMPRIPGRAS